MTLTWFVWTANWIWMQKSWSKTGVRHQYSVLFCEEAGWWICGEGLGFSADSCTRVIQGSLGIGSTSSVLGSNIWTGKEEAASVSVSYADTVCWGFHPGSDSEMFWHIIWLHCTVGRIAPLYSVHCMLHCCDTFISVWVELEDGMCFAVP